MKPSQMHNIGMPPCFISNIHCSHIALLRFTSLDQNAQKNKNTARYHNEFHHLLTFHHHCTLGRCLPGIIEATIVDNGMQF